jgi:hypothetical protein
VPVTIGDHTVSTPRYCLFSSDGAGVALGCATTLARSSKEANTKTRRAIVPAIFIERKSGSKGERVVFAVDRVVAGIRLG